MSRVFNTDFGTFLVNQKILFEGGLKPEQTGLVFHHPMDDEIGGQEIRKMTDPLDFLGYRVPFLLDFKAGHLVRLSFALQHPDSRDPHFLHCLHKLFLHQQLGRPDKQKPQSTVYVYNWGSIVAVIDEESKQLYIQMHWREVNPWLESDIFDRHTGAVYLDGLTFQRDLTPVQLLDAGVTFTHQEPPSEHWSYRTADPVNLYGQNSYFVLVFKADRLRQLLFMFQAEPDSSRYYQQLMHDLFLYHHLGKPHKQTHRLFAYYFHWGSIESVLNIGSGRTWIQVIWPDADFAA